MQPSRKAKERLSIRTAPLAPARIEPTLRVARPVPRLTSADWNHLAELEQISRGLRLVVQRFTCPPRKWTEKSMVPANRWTEVRKAMLHTLAEIDEQRFDHLSEALDHFMHGVEHRVLRTDVAQAMSNARMMLGHARDAGLAEIALDLAVIIDRVEMHGAEVSWYSVVPQIETRLDSLHGRAIQLAAECAAVRKEYVDRFGEEVDADEEPDGCKPEPPTKAMNPTQQAAADFICKQGKAGASAKDAAAAADVKVETFTHDIWPVLRDEYGYCKHPRTNRGYFAPGMFAVPESDRPSAITSERSFIQPINPVA